MKKLLLSLGLWLGFTTLAFAQCIAVGGVNSVPQTGVNCMSEPSVASFAATGIGIVPASSATDVACITGSATKVTRVQRIRIGGTAGTPVTIPILITKHASADTGGTAATTTALPVPYSLDSTNAAATATTTAFTANPTINDASPGLIASGNLPLSTTTASPVGPNGVIMDWESRNFMQAPILRGVAQQVCVNFNSTTVSSGLVAISFEWTEATQ